MLDERQGRGGAVPGWWSRWPAWAGVAATVAAAVYGAVVLATAVVGSNRFAGLAHAAWPATGVLFLGAVMAAATVGTPRGRRARQLVATAAVGASRGRRPRRVVAAGLWGVAGLAAAGSCWVLLSIIELALTGTVRDRDGNSDWVTFAQRLALAGVGALFVATAVSWQRRTAGVCAVCGRAHTGHTSGRRHPEPHAAPVPVRRVAYAGCALFLPYLILHMLGAAGVGGIEPDGFRPPWSAVAAGVLGIGLAVFLLLGLVRPWGMVFPRWTLWFAGRRVPRFLPLTPVWLIAPTLALYGTGSLIYAFFTEYGVLGLGGAASVAFAGYGWALGVAAASYQLRTRPRCSTDRRTEAAA